MSQLNHSFQEILTSNNTQANGLETVPQTAIITSEALQGFSMANQFAICTNPGSAPMLISCLAPMLVPAALPNQQQATVTNQQQQQQQQQQNTTKANFELQDSRNAQQPSNINAIAQIAGQQQPQTVQIQLASPLSLGANNICGTTATGAATSNNVAAGASQGLPSLGLSYINLSSFGGGANTPVGAIPIQITLNNAGGPNQQIQIPASMLQGFNQDIQLGQVSAPTAGAGQPNYQIKYEAEVQSQGQPAQVITLGNHAPQQTSLLATGTGQHTATIVTENNSQPNTASNEIQETDQTHSTQENNNQSGNNGTIAKQPRKKPRRRIPTKSVNKVVSGDPGQTGEAQQQQEVIRLHDHKGRPFVFSCPHCPKRFTLNSRLTAHLRCHTGIRPYTCVQCGFSFTQKSYLIRHAAVHTEERPFTCERCLKTYKHYGSLANHRKLHKKEDKVAASAGGMLGSSLDASHLGGDLDEEILDEVMDDHQHDSLDDSLKNDSSTTQKSGSLFQEHVGQIIDMVASGLTYPSNSWHRNNSTNKKQKNDIKQEMNITTTSATTTPSSSSLTQFVTTSSTGNHGNITYLSNPGFPATSQPQQQQQIFITTPSTNSDASQQQLQPQTIIYTSHPQSNQTACSNPTLLSNHHNNALLAQSAAPAQYTTIQQSNQPQPQQITYNTTTAI